ncbi:MAG: ATP-binding cassette domain-containing protein [Planctomycetaceae bacterium]|nr:ATP-binding cassette domain-containing protein [Planctomycetaceae bacterium]
MTVPARPGRAGSDATPPVVLELRDVSKSFLAAKRRVQALDRVSLTARQGQITGLIGPDAAGKSTLIRLAAGLLSADSGSVAVLGLDAAAQSAQVQAAVGYMPQRFGLYEDLSVRENLDLYASLQGLPHNRREARFDELMPMTGLAPFMSRLAGRLSGGMKQKLGLACALVRSHRLLLLDEPTVGVDPLSRRELWRIIHELVDSHGASVLISTSYMDEAGRCDQVVTLHQGRVLGQDPPAAFIDKAQGRTFTLAAPGMPRRATREKLIAHPDVLDAVVYGQEIRLITRQAQAPEAAALAPDLVAAKIVPASPRFEDGFVILLAAQADHPAHRPSKESATPRAAASTEHPVTIEVRDLTKRFGNFVAVDNVSFEVARGEIFGLLGPNGAGKSTTFRMLCGLLPASGGHLKVAGVDLRHAASAARARIGYMSQKFSLYGDLTVRENLNFFSAAYGLTGRDRTEQIQRRLEQFELDEQADQTSALLPLGYKQRLAMACALVHQPQTIFLDEPTSGVDPLARRVFWNQIAALAESGVTVMVTTHFMAEAEYCDRLAIMDSGRILALGAPEEIRRRAGADATFEDAFIHLIESQRQEDAR